MESVLTLGTLVKRNLRTTIDKRALHGVVSVQRFPALDDHEVLKRKRGLENMHQGQRDPESCKADKRPGHESTTTCEKSTR